MNKRFGKGFTLIEVVLALAVMGIGLTVILELFSGGLRLGRISAENSKAMNYARMKMEEVTLQNSIQEGTEEGEFDGTFRWQVGIEKVEILPIEKNPDFKPPVGLFKVKVDVLWKSGAKERSASIESFKTIKLETDEKKS